MWKELEQALPYARVRLDCGTTSESIDRLLDEKMYPIVKVKRKSGAVHWIMLTGTERILSISQPWIPLTVSSI